MKSITEIYATVRRERPAIHRSVIKVASKCPACPMSVRNRRSLNLRLRRAALILRNVGGIDLDARVDGSLPGADRMPCNHKRLNGTGSDP